MKIMTRKKFLEWFSGQVICYKHSNNPTTSGVSLTTALERWKVAIEMHQPNKVNRHNSVKSRRGIF